MTLLERLNRLHKSSLRAEVKSKPVHEEEWNESARLLKLGIALGAFTAMEDFVKSRVVEILLKLNTTSPKSKALPPPLITALTVNAFKAAADRLKHASRFSISDPQKFVLEQAEKIHSLTRGVIVPSHLALANSNSNVSWTVLDDALGAFAVEKPANVVTSLALRIAGGLFKAVDHFEAASELRHKLAHIPFLDIPQGDVDIHVVTISKICCAFDLALSTAASRVVHGTMLASHPITKSADIKLTFVEESRGSWRFRTESAKRGKIAPDEDAAFQNAEVVATPAHSCVVLRPRDANSPCLRWATPFL